MRGLPPKARRGNQRRDAIRLYDPQVPPALGAPILENACARDRLPVVLRADRVPGAVRVHRHVHCQALQTRRGCRTDRMQARLPGARASPHVAPGETDAQDEQCHRVHAVLDARRAITTRMSCSRRASSGSLLLRTCTIPPSAPHQGRADASRLHGLQ